jgi:hypothetical protein
MANQAQAVLEKKVAANVTIVVVVADSPRTGDRELQFLLRSDRGELPITPEDVQALCALKSA